MFFTEKKRAKLKKEIMGMMAKERVEILSEAKIDAAKLVAAYDQKNFSNRMLSQKAQFDETISQIHESLDSYGVKLSRLAASLKKLSPVKKKVVKKKATKKKRPVGRPRKKPLELNL